MSGPSLSMYTLRGPHAYRDCTGREHCLSTHLRSGRRVVRQSRLGIGPCRDRVPRGMADPLRTRQKGFVPEEREIICETPPGSRTAMTMAGM